VSERYRRQLLRLGDADWQVISTPGHTPGHLALWQPQERLLIVGDALSDYDVGWVNIALDGPDAAALARLPGGGPTVRRASGAPLVLRYE
jgi:glyoxylase-like metal-dependent hydrolase (beta-lactamase superfamily II)